MDLIFRAACKSDFQPMFELCEKCFGHGYIDEKTFDEWCSFGKLFLVAQCDGEFAGYSFMRPESDEKIAEYMHISVDEVRENANGKPSVHYKSAALKKKYEGRGIMQQMTEIGLNDVKAMGYGQVFGPAWKYNNYIPMDRLLTHFGFEQMGTKENIWYDMEDYTCVVCNGRCKCQCVIYRKIFNEKEYL